MEQRRSESEREKTVILTTTIKRRQSTKIERKAKDEKMWALYNHRYCYSKQHYKKFILSCCVVLSFVITTMNITIQYKRILLNTGNKLDNGIDSPSSTEAVAVAVKAITTTTMSNMNQDDDRDNDETSVLEATNNSSNNKRNEGYYILNHLIDYNRTGLCGWQKCFYFNKYNKSVGYLISSTRYNSSKNEVGERDLSFYTNMQYAYNLTTTKLQKHFPQIQHFFHLGPPFQFQLNINTFNNNMNDNIDDDNNNNNNNNSDEDDTYIINKLNLASSGLENATNKFHFPKFVQRAKITNGTSNTGTGTVVASTKTYYNVPTTLYIQPSIVAPYENIVGDSTMILSCQAFRDSESVPNDLKSLLHERILRDISNIAQHQDQQQQDEEVIVNKVVESILVSFFNTLQDQLKILSKVLKKVPCLKFDFQYILDNKGYLYHFDVDRCYKEVSSRTRNVPQHHKNSCFKYINNIINQTKVYFEERIKYDYYNTLSSNSSTKSNRTLTM